MSCRRLASCGGVARDIAEGAVSEPLDAMLCGLQNCTESSTLRVDEISPRFSATQTDGEQAVVIDGSLGKSANLFTTVLMAPNESLSASVDGGPEVALSNPDGKRWRYTARLAATSAQLDPPTPSSVAPLPASRLATTSSKPWCCSRHPARSGILRGRRGSHRHRNAKPRTQRR